MKTIRKNLLSRKFIEGAALSHQTSKIKSRVSLSALEGLQRLKIIHTRFFLAAFLLLFVSGLSPTIAFPPVKQSQALAENTQQYSIEAMALPNPMYLPHPGYISTPFSWYHPGIDIATGLGMPIHPISGGLVEEVNYGFLGYGNNVVVNHAGGFKSMYAHMGRIFVKVGQSVNHHNIIGEVGLTGHTSGPHTHLEVYKDGKNIDPLTILPLLPSMPVAVKN